MMAKWGIALVLGVVTLTGAEAHAHRFELGITLEPTFSGLPAVADDNSIPTLALGAGGGLGIEFMPTKYLAIVSHFSYAHPVTQSRIGRATFGLNTGDYYFSQAGVLGRLGLRIETPTWWLPVQFFLEAGAGAALLIQDKRQLVDDRGTPYEIPLPTLVKVSPLIALSSGMFIRAAEHVRFNVDGSLYLLPGRRLGVGFGITLGITFIFLT